ncbi:MAG: YabP/YqfC family sporulation protein [Eubacteriales bacterium]|nr:YabP/YqfC family sporulation protein [Clostridiales bacterium]
MESKTPSNIVLASRKSLSVTGVKEVSGFDELQIEADTSEGMLFVRGKNLRIVSFDRERGALELSGTVDGLVYGVKEAKKSFLSRLFG